MGRPLSMDLRERVVAAVRSGISRRQAAAQFAVVPSAVVDSTRQRARSPLHWEGWRASEIFPGRRTALVRTRLMEKPDISLRELLAELTDRGLAVSYFAVWNIVRRGGLSFKKSLHAREQDRLDVARRRLQLRRHQGKIDVTRLIFIDETGPRWT